ncbi:MAG: hypothetical protein R3D65_16995 [Zhengella sp.]|uniref:hypothetical protein n=1 Tax=Zhengella sp. TaxID=2282762 RepID=UPI001D6FD953|nr:hypothetical protein [Notoacmeibacter sp.]MCC0028503.1 hypothetical protein [Brucellaceae bacterium]
MNPLAPNRMTTSERLGEVARILSAGMVRLHARQSSVEFGEDRECRVDFRSGQSVSRTNRKAGTL